MSKSRKTKTLFDNDTENSYYGGYTDYDDSNDSYNSYNHSSRSGFGFGRNFWTNYRDNQKDDVVHPDLDWIREDDLNALPGLVKYQYNTTEELPQFMSRDIFKMYYNHEKDVEFRIAKGKRWWQYLLSETDNYMMKIITRNNFANSYLLTRCILKNISEIIKKQDQLQNQMQYDEDSLQKQNDEQKSKNNSSQREDQNNQQQQQEKIKHNSSAIMDQVKQAIKQGLKQASKEIAKKDKFKKITGISDEDLENGENMNLLQYLLEDIKNIKLSKNELMRFIKRSIKGMKSAIAGKIRKKEENMLEADEISDISEVHLLNIMELLDEMEVTSDIRSFKFNAYIDCSGSMDKNTSLSEGENIRRMTLAKLLMFKMKNMKILNHIRRFETIVSETIIPHDRIMILNAGGGTCIDNVIKHIAATRIPSLIVSDGEDAIHQYDPNAFILCLTHPVEMDCGKDKCGEKFINGRQMILYNNGKFSYPFIKKGRLNFNEEKSCSTKPLKT